MVSEKLGSVDESIIKCAKSCKNGELTFAMFEKSLASTKLSTLGLTLATTALNVALSMGIAFAIQGIVSAVSDWAKADEITAEKAEELTQKLKEQREETEKNRQSLGNLEERYNELSRGVSDNGKNISLTSSEYDEYKNVVSQLSDLLPDLTVIFDEHGQKIGFVAGQLKDANKQYDEYLRKEAVKKWNASGDNSVDNITARYNNSRRQSEEKRRSNYWDYQYGRLEKDDMAVKDIDKVISDLLTLDSNEERYEYIHNYGASTYLLDYLSDNGIAWLEGGGKVAFQVDKARELLEYARRGENISRIAGINKTCYANVGGLCKTIR